MSRGKEEEAQLLAVHLKDPTAHVVGEHCWMPRFFVGQSKNVPLMFLYNFVDGAAFSIWQAQVLQVLLYNISGNTTVGWVSGVAGAAQIVGALVAGYVGDTLRRDTVCRVASLTGLIGVITSLYAVAVLWLPMFFVSGVIWGVYMGLANSSSEALFADSISSGKRAKLYTFKWIVQILCYCVGYLMCLILFLTMGDTWSNSTMQVVLYIGLGLHPASLFVLALLSDGNSLSENKTVDEVIGKKQDEAPPEPTAQDLLIEQEGDDDASTAGPATPITATPAGSLQRATEEHQARKASKKGHKGLLERCVSWKAVPYFICTGDFVLAFGSGMTLRYISLFLVNSYNISPSLLMGTFLIISFTTSVISMLVRTCAERWLGRVPAMLFCRLIGTTLLLYIAVVPEQSAAAPLGVVLAFIIVRNGCMNSTLGLSRSVLMDCSLKEHRARWTAMESFSSFTWAGSATLGGYLSDMHGYRFTFLITVVFHYVGCMCLIPAWWGSRKIEKIVMEMNRKKRSESTIS